MKKPDISISKKKKEKTRDRNSQERVPQPMPLKSGSQKEKIKHSSFHFQACGRGVGTLARSPCRTMMAAPTPAFVPCRRCKPPPSAGRSLQQPSPEKRFGCLFHRGRGIHALEAASLLRPPWRLVDRIVSEAASFTGSLAAFVVLAAAAESESTERPGCSNLSRSKYHHHTNCGPQDHIEWLLSQYHSQVREQTRLVLYTQVPSLHDSPATNTRTTMLGLEQLC